MENTASAGSGMENFAPIGPELEAVSPDFSIANMTPTFSEFVGAQARQAWRDNATPALVGAVELAGANASQNGAMDEFGVYQPGNPTAAPRFNAEYAKAKADAAGVSVDWGKADYTGEAIDIMVRRAGERASREQLISSYNPSFLTSAAVSLATAVVDPLNVASAFIPVVGEARYAGMLAKAGGFGGRTGVRAAAGAAEGLVGAAVLEPIIYGAATQEGRDYSLADSMRNLLFGAAFGSGLHVAGGTFAEKVAGRTYANAPATVPEDIVDRLPQEAKDAAMRAALADLHAGRAVQSADVIDQLTQLDPGLADTVLYARTLRRDGPDLDDTVARIAYWQGKLSSGVPKVTREAGDAGAREEADYIASVIAQSGVDPKALPEARARAIVGHEQQLVAAERARVAGAMARLEARRVELLQADQPKPAPKEDPKKEAKAPPAPADKVDIGDTVEVDGKEVLVTHMMQDPVYGDHVELEGGSQAVRAEGLKVAKKGAKPQDTLSAKVEQDKKDATAARAAEKAEGPKTETKPPLDKEQAAFTKAATQHDTGVKMAIGRQVLDARYPALAAKGEYYYSAFLGMREHLEISLEGGRKWLNKAIEKGEIVVRDDTGKVLNKVDSRYGELDFNSELPDLLIKFEDKAKPKDTAPTGAKRRLMDKQKKQLGPLSPEENARVSAEAARVGSKLAQAKAASADLAKATEELAITGSETQKELAKIEAELDAMKAKADAKALADAGPREPAPDMTPPAPREALDLPELKELTATTQALEAQTMKRLDQLIKTMTPDQAQGIRAQLSRIDTEGADLNTVYEAAVACLLKA